ncbi:hypothetical protein DTO027I6_9808 [Penicillium roqueforti]|nr:hypothetical protein CBS147337_9899 [Penicillium roqueforti]KAI3185292.1 hypothetical protein DTO027I6_9808 [Penicillium roqueforti]
MSTLVHDSPDRAVTAIEPLTGSDNFATWKRLMTSYLKARQNDKDPVNPTTIGNWQSNAEQTVRRKESPAPPPAALGPSVNTVQNGAKKCSYCKKRGHVYRTRKPSFIW